MEAGLYLPQDWAADRQRRATRLVPAAVTFPKKWRLGLELLDRVRQELPGRWVAGDEAFGRCRALGGQLRRRQLGYVLDLPCNTLVRDLSERRPPDPRGSRVGPCSSGWITGWSVRPKGAGAR